MTEKTKNFLRKLKNSGNWNDNYDYSNINYINNTKKVLVVDKKFNTKHLISPSNIIKGVKCFSKNLKDGYLNFEEARAFVHKLKLKNSVDWKDYSKSDKRPHNIPTNPNTVYSEFISFPDWLGTKLGFKGYEWLSFEDARAFVHELNLKSSKDWNEYCKDKPNNIPSSPMSMYKDEWLSFPDWLGTKPGFKGHDWLPFEEARAFVQELGFKNVKQWTDYSRDQSKNPQIPSDPSNVYKDEWLSLYDWMGTEVGFIGRGKQEYINYDEAKKIVHTLNLKSQKEWIEYCNSKSKPKNIPSDPRKTYLSRFKNINDFSWSDWLGYIGNGNHAWTKDYMLNYIKSLEQELNNLDAIELITIINSNNLSRKLKEIGSLTDLLKTQPGTKERKDAIDNVISKIESCDITDDAKTNENETNNSVLNEEIIEIDDLESIIEPVSNPVELLKKTDPIDELDIYDNTKITASLDDENIDFLLKNKLNKLWNSVLNNEVNIEEFKTREGGKNFNIIKDWFFKEYDDISKIEIPKDYIFEHKPNLMQKLITYRLINKKRYANWSGTGAGKTLSAIFAGRYAGAKNTLIICLNSNVNGWVNSIHRYFDNSNVFTKKELDSEVSNDKYSVINKYNINFDDSKNNYLILNYETFQLENSEYIISELLKNNRIDYVILDEAQNVKQRDEDKQSSRRDVVNKLIIHSNDLNESLMVLPMTATPIINNLIEGKKLIELITGKVHDELETSSTIMNGIEMYKAMTRYGLRYKPNYNIIVNEEIVNIDGSKLIDKIISVPKGSVIDIEKVLLQTKLDGIKDKIKKGTLIYTHYVTELSNNIGEYVEKMGFSIGYYIGDEKRGLELFKNGKIDVLIGSAPVGTGVDGIQYVCDTLIPIVLPWTSAEYEQLKGRIVRQGSNFTSTNIYLPQVTIPVDNGVWSWDIKRYNIIKYKSTLADLAVDGSIPDTLIPTRSKLIEDSKKELNDWINRLNNEEIITFEREELRIPLNTKQFEIKKIQLGDFSTLNKSWSTSNSITINNRLSEDPSEWYYYHSLYSEARKNWNEIPFIEISKRIKSRPDWIVGDFGCGENLLSKEIDNKVYAFDHIAIDNKVVACDIKNVPLDDSILDVVVFSLSLMGNNYEDYIKEAKRTLKSYGQIFICEPLKKWNGRENDLIEVLEKNSISGRVINKTNKFIYINGTRLD